jgi:AraC family transcriptional regulator, arabinose operon regulatory protein
MIKINSGFLGERVIVLPPSILDELRKDELCELLYITDIGFYPKAENHYRSRTAKEAINFILFYCYEGEGWFEIAGIKQIVKSNHFFILPMNVSHSYGSSTHNPWTIYWIHFNGEKAAFFAKDFNKPKEILPDKNSRIEERLRLFEEMFSTLRNGYSITNLQYTTSLFLYFLGSFKFLNSFHLANRETHKNHDIVADSIHYMHENISKQLSLKELVTYVGLSPTHFNSLFKEKTGTSPLNYFKQLKIQHACHLLDCTDYKINQISKMIGYDDPMYFSKIFAKIMGVTSTTYRNIKKG